MKIRSSQRPLWSCAVGLLLALQLPTLGHCETKDRVRLLKPNGARVGVTGTIVEYTGREIRIRVKKGTEPLTYETENVVGVSYTRTRDHALGLEAFENNNFEEALRHLGIALDEEERRWVRREILALQVRCAVRMGHYGPAATRFLTIVESDPETHFYKYIPLIWTARELSAEDKTRARQWIESSSATARLIGASFLLDDPLKSETALQILRKLGTHPDARAFGLSRAQLWRKDITQRKVGAQDLEAWTDHLERTPEELRAGPYYLLGRAYLARGEHEKAAQAFLWLPLVYDENPLLASRACLEAAHALKLAGKPKQSDALLREVATRFQHTPYAAEARTELKNSTAN